jgi:hypothetical protein
MSLAREAALTATCSLVAAAAAYGIWRLLGFGEIVLGGWALVEVAFFAVQRLRYHRLNQVNQSRPSAEDIDQRFQHFLTLAHGPVLDIRDFISGWFLNIDFAQIRIGNLADFIAYSYWCASAGCDKAVCVSCLPRCASQQSPSQCRQPARIQASPCRYQPRADLDADEQARVLEYAHAVERAWGVQFPEGYNEDLHLMGHLWEPLKVVHKPLFVHLASEGSMFVTHLALQVRLADWSVAMLVCLASLYRSDHPGGSPLCDSCQAHLH